VWFIGGAGEAVRRRPGGSDGAAGRVPEHLGAETEWIEGDQKEDFLCWTAGPATTVTVEFTGLAGHAGMPHRAVDPIVSVASFVLQIQAMIARSFDPTTGGVVVTFGTISGGTVVNGVAASAKVIGTLRFLDSAQHDLAFRRIREIAERVALATGATASVRLEDSPWVPVRNDPVITARFTDYMLNQPGVAFEDAPVTMASEDYGYLISRIPGRGLPVSRPDPRRDPARLCRDEHRLAGFCSQTVPHNAKRPSLNRGKGL
jgi:metal-dependent amidase/aminoacylase/carboxypeptidase family protein